MRLVTRSVVAGILFLGLGTGLALAQALDAPSLRYIEAGHGSITIEVTAGPSGAPAGFALQWMKKSVYDQLGWPANEYDPSVVYCDFYGIPTVNISTGNFVLQAGGLIEVQVGDLFDETGMYGNSYDELEYGQAYVFRGKAEGDGYSDESSYSPTLEASTKTPSPDNCVFTQGYWKNHPENWPVLSLPLGNPAHVYTQTELLAIFNTPAQGNGLISMAHQLIATKLNIAKGADATPIAATVVAADNLIGNKIVPPTVGSTDLLDPSQTSDLTEDLDKYNSGKTTVPHCNETPVRPATWGGVKASYR